MKNCAVAEDKGPLGQQQVVRVGEQADAGGGREALAEQKIAVAVHEGDLQPCVRGGAQRGDDARVVRVVEVVVADPHFEQVAEDVERFRLPGTASQKAEEQSSRPG